LTELLTLSRLAKLDAITQVVTLIPIATIAVPYLFLKVLAPSTSMEVFWEIIMRVAAVLAADLPLSSVKTLIRLPSSPPMTSQ
jgi:hypothetical protein